MLRGVFVRGRGYLDPGWSRKCWLRNGTPKRCLSNLPTVSTQEGQEGTGQSQPALEFKTDNFCLWYPAAQSMNRKIFMHVGPTNSGKTYHAIERLRNAKTGIYCAPLRLLAWQVSNDINCNLVTGQERVSVEGSGIVSCTVEMCELGEVDDSALDVAVIDEIQLIGDEHRGYAFTRALLGVPAREVHLCGEEGAVELVRNICKMSGEELVINRYERLSPLEVDSAPLSDIKDVRPGDCVVVFSRRNIYLMKHLIEKQSKHRCAVVYGSLPPETRKAQAQAFNSESNERSVLVSTDAVGMGLNLRIKRIVLSSIKKFDGKNVRTLSIPEIKQIAGRAGRYGHTDEDAGVVTALEKEALGTIKTAIDSPFIPVKSAFIYPPRAILRSHTVNMMIDLLSEVDVSQVAADISSPSGDPEETRELQSFAMAQVAGRIVNDSFMHVMSDVIRLNQKLGADREQPYTLSSMNSMRTIVTMLRDIPLDFSTLYTLSLTPLLTQEPRVLEAFKKYAKSHSKRTRSILFELEDELLLEKFKLLTQFDRTIEDIYSPGKMDIHPYLKLLEKKDSKKPTSPEMLRSYEIDYNIVEMYLWLGRKFNHSEALCAEINGVRIAYANALNEVLGKERAFSKAKKQVTEEND
mmetsp:Transcript_10978/g.20314  ORF Transcript_10978/g.20314 Transcript_10978/m.20314 type:complete len:635 (+) Transcript_10978:124-2028(+)